MALAKPIRRLTEAEYLEIERAAERKSEFFDGEMFAMAGGSPEHSLIAANAVGELRHQLKGRPCVVFDSNLRVKIEATGLSTYPDATVVCGPRRFARENPEALVNPTVIVEVLSDSTEADDRGKKFEHYRQLPSLREYLLVSQKEPRVEQFVRQENGQWLFHEAEDLDSTLLLPSLGVTIALSEVFANIDFSTPSLRTETPPRA